MMAYYMVKNRVPADIMKQETPLTDSKFVLHLSLAILFAVRCRQQDAVLQLLNKMYHTLEEDQTKTTMNRLIYLLEPQERDWLKALS
jgi:hypothetical protein